MRAKWVRPLLLAAAILLAVMMLWTKRTLDDARSLQAKLNEVQTITEGNPGQGDLHKTVILVHDLHTNMTALKFDAAPFLWVMPYLGWVPHYGGDLQSVPDLLTLGETLSQAGDIAVTAFSPLLEQHHGSSELAPRALLALEEAQPDLAKARDLLDEASRARRQIQFDRLSPRLQKWIVRVDRILPLAQTAVDGALVAPRLLGADRPRAYLILAQNDDELRATGGFITAVGVVRIEKGRIIDFSFADSYAVDDLSKNYPDPPRPLFDYMLADQWLLRDSNWSPDFPTTAKQAAYFYKYGTGLTTDGVIALDMQALRLVVGAVGPLNIPGSTTPITGDNVIDWVRQARGGILPGEGLGNWWKDRKDFVGPLALAIKSRLETGQVNWTSLTGSLEKGLVEKHILVYPFDPQAEALLSSRGWDGAVKSPLGDYLFVVDSNLGFNKVNPLVDERLDYQVNVAADGVAQGDLRISYINHSKGTAADCDPHPRYGATYDEDMNRCYWDYLRVYVPEGSRLLQATPAPLPEASLYNRKWGGVGRETLTIGPPELEKQIFGEYLLVPRGESREQSFEYGLPRQVVRREVADWIYSLMVQKQPGSRDLPVTITLNLPSGSQVLETDPAPTEQNGTVLIYKWALSQERTLQVRYR